MNYNGDVSAKACWQALNGNLKARLIDVRTHFELEFIGRARLDAPLPPPLFIPWSLDMAGQNQNFIPMLQAAISDIKTPLYFLCRSGGRSQFAAIAAAQSGYALCYNIEHGFEGDLDDKQQRGNLNGWRYDGLPWLQG